MKGNNIAIVAAIIALVFIITRKTKVKASVTELAPSMANLYGRVYDITTSQPITGACIELEGSGIRWSDSNGLYSWNNIPSGYYQIVITKDKYRQSSRYLNIGGFKGGDSGQNEVDLGLFPIGGDLGQGE